MADVSLPRPVTVTWRDPYGNVNTGLAVSDDPELTSTVPSLKVLRHGMSPVYIRRDEVLKMGIAIMKPHGCQAANAAEKPPSYAVDATAPTDELPAVSEPKPAPASWFTRVLNLFRGR
jgi:hypothetical protein